MTLVIVVTFVCWPGFGDGFCNFKKNNLISFDKGISLSIKYIDFRVLYLILWF